MRALMMAAICVFKLGMTAIHAAGGEDDTERQGEDRRGRTAAGELGAVGVDGGCVVVHSG